MKNRREFIALSIGASGSFLVPPSLAMSRPLTADVDSVGPLILWILCHVDGVDVTDRCYEASEEGWAKLYKHRDGKPYIDSETREPAREVLTGRVQFSLKPDTPDHLRKYLPMLRRDPEMWMPCLRGDAVRDEASRLTQGDIRETTSLGDTCRRWLFRGSA